MNFSIRAATRDIRRIPRGCDTKTLRKTLSLCSVEAGHGVATQPETSRLRGFAAPLEVT